jgi:hypothetical protein
MSRVSDTARLVHGHRLAARVTAVLASALALGLVGPSGAFACTTALSPRPLADYRAATPVVLGTLEEIGPADITVRVEVVYRGSVGSRLRLALPSWPNVMGWCAFPWGPPAVGDRLLVAVVDPDYWEWPNSAVWIVDGQGRILSPPVAPWSGAPAPGTVAEALRTMGIAPVPDTAMASPVPPGRAAWAATPIALIPWLAGLAWMVGWLRRPIGRSTRTRGAHRASGGRDVWLSRNRAG